MGIGESHTLACQAVAMRRGGPATRMRQISIPKVISENEYDVWLVGGVNIAEQKYKPDDDS